MEPDPEQFLATILSLQNLLAIIDISLIWSICLVIVLIICSALVSGSEIAFFSIPEDTLKSFRTDTKNKTNNRIIAMLDNPRKLLATILIANNAINIGIILLSDFLLKRLVPEEVFTTWGQQLVESTGLSNWFSAEAMADFLSFMITVAGVTFLLVLFGEITPKVYARLNNVKLARFMANPLWILERLFKPLISILINGTGFIERKLSELRGVHTSREEIDEAIDLAVSADDAPHQEVDILKSIVKFGDVEVTQIMRPRLDVIAIDKDNNFHEVLEIVKKSGYSRIPIYEENLDTIFGILYIKDLVQYLDEVAEFDWTQLVHVNSMYVPEIRKIDDVLKDFQQKRVHMAIVVDEYGGTSGIVTLEDILEEIVGDIRDESDENIEQKDKHNFRKINPYTYHVEGKTLLNDFYRNLEIEQEIFKLEKGEADTIAGLILEQTGRLPKKGLKVVLQDYTFKIKDVDKRRIKTVEIILPNAPDNKK